jgi:hypothetical protein
MGLFSGSTTTKINEKFDTGPSSFQTGYLKNVFDSATDIYNSSKSTPYYDEPTYAGMSAEDKDALTKLKGYASGTGLDTANSLYTLGSSMAGYGAKAGSTLDRFTAIAGEDPTQANIASAQKYADNPYLDAQIDANSRDITRNLTEGELPSIDRAASANGNINSSRAGVAAGIARRGAEDRIGDVSATLRGNAYNNGLSLAQADRTTNMNAMGTAANAYGNLASFGADALGKSSDAAYGAYGAITGANSQEQADRQGQATADFQKWQGQDTRASDLLGRWADVVAGNQWGQSGTSSGTNTAKTSGSILNQIMGAANSAASIYTGTRSPQK